MVPVINMPQMLDLAIIGGGPAALSAAIYATQAGLKTTIFERSNFGGALGEIDQLTNYPGFSGSGAGLATSLRTQAQSAGASLDYGTCTDIQLNQDHTFRLVIDDQTVTARTVLVATGSEPRTLDFEIAKPVSYCALCDSAFVKNEAVAVVGGANSAVQEALYLSKIAKHVTLITHSALKAKASLQERLHSVQNVTVCEHTEPTRELLDKFDRVFVYIGKRPASDFLQNLAASLPKDTPMFDEQGYVCTRTSASRMTPVPGLFIAGDLRSGAIRQVITAASDGAAAAIEIGKYLSELS